MIRGVEVARPPRRHVRVWFGEHVIANYVAEAPLAERYEHAMKRRFAGLRVTNDPLGPIYQVTECTVQR